MVSRFLDLIKQLTRLSEVRDKNKQQYFDRYVEPTYRLAEEVYRDYMKLFRDLNKKIARAKKIETIIRFLEERRLDYLPVRMKLRAILAERDLKNNLSKFEKGIWGLMTGSMSTLDSRRIDTYPLRSPTELHHTVLDLLNYISRSEPLEPLTSLKPRIMHSSDIQIQTLDFAWSQVVEGYAELQAAVVPKVKMTKERKKRTS